MNGLHATRHIERALMYLGTGFGTTPHITCYTTAAVLKDLQFEDMVTSDHYRDLNSPEGRKFKQEFGKNTALLRKLTQGRLTMPYISDELDTSNLIIVSHDTAGSNFVPASIRGFALCKVGTLVNGNGIMELLVIGNAEHCAMNIRSKARPKGSDVLNEVMRLGSKLEDGIRAKVLGSVIPFYWKHGFRFRPNCSTDTGSDSDADIDTINWHRDELYREAVKNLSQFTKAHTNRFVSKTMRRSAKYKAEEDTLIDLLRPFSTQQTAQRYEMILCQDKNIYS